MMYCWKYNLVSLSNVISYIYHHLESISNLMIHIPSKESDLLDLPPFGFGMLPDLFLSLTYLLIDFITLNAVRFETLLGS